MPNIVARLSHQIRLVRSSEVIVAAFTGFSVLACTRAFQLFPVLHLLRQARLDGDDVTVADCDDLLIFHSALFSCA